MVQKYKIAPQMREYDNLGFQWLPGVMFFQKPHQQHKVVSTDKYGFRHSTQKNGQLLDYDQFIEIGKQSPTGIILGGSGTFGVGATHNQYTVPSVLNRITDITWFNFGGRAFNSTQETLLLLLHRPQRIRHLVVYGGINNLVLSCLVGKTSSIYNCIFPQKRFEEGMENMPEKGWKPALKMLTTALYERFFPPSPPIMSQPNSQQYQEVLQVLDRDLALLTSYCQSIGCQLHFALHPMPNWIDKPFTENEKVMLDLGRQNMAHIQTYIEEKGEDYRKSVATLCQKHQIPLIDFNNRPEFTTEESVFLDSNHLTDLGYQRCAEIMKQEWNW